MDKEKEQRAIGYFQTFEPQDEPYYLCYSGGKDSDVIRILADLAGVKHEIVHNITTVDAPETMKYIRSIPGVIMSKPEMSMAQLIVKKKFPPTRIARYCCEVLKERGGKGRMKVTGVRWAESPNRKANQGRVTIIGKSKTVQKEAEENDVNFTLTVRGGGAERRQFRNKAFRGALLQNHTNHDKPYCGLDGRRCVGISPLLRLRIKSALSVRRIPYRLHRLPDARRQRPETRFCKVAGV